MRQYALPILFITVLMLSGCPAEQDGPSALPAATAERSAYYFPVSLQSERVVTGQTLYVPVYSNIYLAHQGVSDLATTLSIRNIDPAVSIIITAVDYYDTSGQRIERYLKEPYQLTAMASTHFFVDQADTRGGPGANFVVEWVAYQKVNVPITEAVMAGINGTRGFSFVSAGHIMKRTPEGVGKTPVTPAANPLNSSSDHPLSQP